MSRKIFISYKYADTGVRALPGVFNTKARDYVTVLQAHLDANDHINKGELDNESLAQFKNSTIESKLRGKIYDSTITIVLISKNMKDPVQSEDEQWIPWEISYSLKEHTRDGRTSSTNAVLAVVVPDELGSYNHFVQDIGCGNGCRTWFTDSKFKIIGENMFNRKAPNTMTCANHGEIHTGNDHSYIHPVKWDDFIADVNRYINTAIQINGNIEHYNIVKVA